MSQRRRVSRLQQISSCYEKLSVGRSQAAEQPGDSVRAIRQGTGDANYKDRRCVLLPIGGLMLLVGGLAAFAGPVEMYCFTLFSAGGRFHYEGFGFGSFMFGNIAAQIIGYYLIAVILIPLAYGHLRLRRWALPLTLAFLWSWVVLGIPLSLAFLFALLSAKPLSFIAALVAVMLVGVAYPAIPGLLIRFYRSKDVRMTFKINDHRSYWIDRLPIPVLVLGIVFSFYVVVWHLLILFNGAFPLVGNWLNGLPGIVVIDVASLCLVGLIWGVLSQRRWAWWGSLLYFVLMTISWLATLATSDWSDVLEAVGFPPFEMEILEQLPLQGVHLAILAGVPLLMTVGAILGARRCFEARRQEPA